MAHVTDYDVWHVSEAPVTVEMVIRVLLQNTALAQQALGHLVDEPANRTACACATALADAIITSRDRIPPDTRERLAALVGKYL